VLNEFANGGGGAFPCCLADANGVIYVATNSGGTVQMWAPSFARTFATLGPLSAPLRWIFPFRSSGMP
jgi:hypothetical protein